MTTARNVTFYFEMLDAAGAVIDYNQYAFYPYYGSGNRFIDGRLRSAGSYSKTIFSENALRGVMQIGALAVTLDNTDGGLDSLADYSFDGQFAELFDNTASTYDWNVTDCVLEQVLFSEKDVTFAIRDSRHKFDKPLMTKKYAGTNTGSPLAGIEGTAEDIKGQPKPLCIGRCFNVTPVLVNTSKLIYQVDAYDGLIGPWSLTVYDKRAALTQGADYADQAAMEATAPAAGQFRVWPAGGCFRIASTPTGMITCDVIAPPQDPENTAGGYAPPATAAAACAIPQLVKRLVWYADADADGVQAAQSYTTNYGGNTIGLFLKAETSILTALEEVLSAANGYLAKGYGIGGAFEGYYYCQLYDPDAPPFTPSIDPIELGTDSIIPNTLQQVPPAGAERGLPVWRINFNYKRNYTVMGDSDLAGVAALDQEFCKREYRTLTKEDAAIKTKWPNSVEMNVFSNWANSTVAQTEVDRLFTLYSVERRMYRVAVKGAAIREQAQFTSGAAEPRWFQPGFIVNVTYPRYDLTAGKKFVATGISYDIDTDVYNMTIWG